MDMKKKTRLNISHILTFYELEQAKNFLNALIHLCTANGVTLDYITNESRLNGLTKEEYVKKSKIVQITIIDEEENTNE